MELNNQILKIADVVERNGRMYPRETLEKAVENVQERIKNEQGILGVLGEPCDVGIILLDNLSHVVTNLRMENDRMMADIRILDTPKGRELKTLIESGQAPQFSISGFGNVREDGKVEELKITTVYSTNSIV